MSNIVNIPEREPPDRHAIEAEARAWLVQLDGHRPSPEELGEFREWLARSPFHREAFIQAAAAWNDMDALAILLDPGAADTRRRPSIGRGAADLLGRAFSRPATVGLLLMAVFIGALAGLRLAPQYFPDRDFVAEYSTAVGELRNVSLPDGSSVRLNTDSRMDVTFSQQARIVRLSGGEAWFDVHHNTSRPFIVYAGRVAVRAVGTAFSVYVRDSKVDLTVTDGRIEVASLQQAAPSLAVLDPEAFEQAAIRVPLAKGQHVVFDGEIELVQRIEPAQIEKRLSWRDGMLIFDNDTLEEVVDEINRYTSTRVIISDSDIRNMRFGGYFRSSDVTSILASLEESFGIRVERIRPDLVYLSRSQDED